MGIRRLYTDLRDLRRSVVELFADDAAAEEAASYALADAACRFSRNSKDVVDDKLTFSATLMRAGEVQAANRLLEEVEREVRTEEAALIETVNEVKVAQTLRRERMTRLRLARTLAVALLGGSLLTFSAAGMALASFLQDRSRSNAEQAAFDRTRIASSGGTSARKGSASQNKRMRRLRIGDVKMVLTKSEFDRLKELTGGGEIGQDELAQILGALPAPLADKLQQAMTVATAETEEVSSSLEQVAISAPKLDRKKRRAAKAAAQEAAEDKEEPEPTDPQPSPEPTEPTDNPDEQKGSNDKGDDEGDGTQEEEGGDEGPPVPIKP